MSHTRASDRKTQMGIGSKVNHTIQNKLSREHFKAGDVSNKIPIMLSDGKTIVFAKSEKDVDEVRKHWEERIKHIL